MEKKYLFFLLVLFIITIPFIYALMSPYISCTEYIHSKNTFNSVCHMERNNRLEEKGLFSDKLQAKKYLEKNYPEINFARVLYELNQPKDILNIDLPKNFYLKSSNGCGNHILFKNGKKVNKKTKKLQDINKEELVKELEKWKKEKFGDSYGLLKKLPYFNFKELHYNYNNNDIFMEEYFDDVYEFRTYYGKQELLFCESIKDGKFKFFNRNWEPIPDVVRNIKITKKNYAEKPKCFEEIIKFTDNFIKKTKFNLIRIDFFVNKEGTDFYFGEFTFCPNNCLRNFSKYFNDQHKELFSQISN